MASLSGKELGRQHAQVVANPEHAARDACALCASSDGKHNVQQRQREADTGAAKQRAPRDRAVSAPGMSFSVHDRSSLVPEKIALHDALYDAADSIAGSAGFLENIVNLFAIREADGRARGVRGELPHQVPGDLLLFVFQQ